MLRLRSVALAGILAACNSDPVSPPVFDPSSIASNTLAVAGQVTCVLQSSGLPYCFGSSYPDDSFVPGEGTLRFVQISGTWQHFCALTSEGDAYCWGVNLYGELGDSTRVRRDLPGGIGIHTASRVRTNVKFKAIATGAYTSCALDAGGAAWCWGRNSDGQLGSGVASENDVAVVPQRVSGSKRFTSIDGGHVYCATESGGSASCWGRVPGSFDPNHYQEPGDCTGRFYIWYVGNDCLTPTPLGGSHSFSSTTRGRCGVDLASKAWCWGDGFYGQLGDGRLGAYTVLPVAVVGDHSFSTVAAGTLHVCALDMSGAAWCWGLNNAGQLGIGTDSFDNPGGIVLVEPEPQAVLTDERFVELAAEEHTCGFTTDRRLFCWGLQALGNRPVRRHIP